MIDRQALDFIDSMLEEILQGLANAEIALPDDVPDHPDLPGLNAKSSIGTAWENALLAQDRLRKERGQEVDPLWQAGREGMAFDAIARRYGEEPK